jgi:AcrR family transcriptional regulator
VAENQRRRLLAGASRTLAEYGYAALTVQRIIAAAGVSRATFYERFDDKRDCILAAHRDAFERLLATVVRACAAEREWPAKVKAAIGAALAFAAGDPGAMHLLALNAAVTDAVIARRVIDSSAHLAALLRDGRRRTSLGPSLPGLTEEALIGGLFAIIAERLFDGREESSSMLEAELTQLVLTPYVGGHEAALVAGRAEAVLAS